MKTKFEVIDNKSELQEKREKGFEQVSIFLDDQIRERRESSMKETKFADKQTFSKDINNLQHLNDIMINHENYDKKDFNKVLVYLEDRAIAFSYRYNLNEDDKEEGQKLRESMSFLTTEVYSNDHEPIRSVADARVSLRNIFNRVKEYSVEKEEYEELHGPRLGFLEKAMDDLEKNNFESVVDVIDLFINELIRASENGDLDDAESRKFYQQKYGVIQKTIKQLRQARSVLFSEIKD